MARARKRGGPEGVVAAYGAWPECEGMMVIRQAIVTRYLGPTSSRGSRIKATAYAGSVTVSRDYSLGHEADHARAARALADKLGWGGVWYGGGLPSDDGYVFVDASKDWRADNVDTGAPAFTLAARDA